MSDAANLKYDVTTIALHWATALVVAALWAIGQTADWLPKGPVRSAYWSVHVVVGFLFAALIAYRLYWRFTSGRRLPDAEPGLLGLVGKATHHVLYLLLLIVVVLGVANAFVRGYHLFDVVDLPQLGDPAWKKRVSGLHGLLSNVLMALAAFHAAAAIKHYLIDRDQILQRMAR